MQSFIRKQAGVAALVALALLFTACSQPPATPEATIVIQPTIFATTPPTETPLPTATPAPTATPIPPKPINVPQSGSIDSLHPFYATSPAARTVAGALFVGCIGEDDKGQPVALGCEGVPTADNAGAVFVGEGADRFLQATFKIKPDWRWTDGRPVTAQDAIYAWQLIMSPESGLRDPLTQQVFSMTAPDERTLMVSFMSAAQAQAAANGALRGDVPFEYFTQLGDYAQYANAEKPLSPANYASVVRWLPAHLLREVPPAQQRESAFAQKPVGDGAFEIDEVASDRITLKPAAQPFALGQGIGSGLAFALNGAAADDEAPQVLLDPPAGAPADALSTTLYPAGVEQLVLNVDRFPFDDVKVRQALAHAINRDVFVQGSTVATATNSALAYDLAKSKALLQEAGWNCDTLPCVKAVTNDAGEAISRPLAFKLTTTEREPRNLVAQEIQKQLAQAGFAVDVEIVFGLGRQSRMFAPHAQGGVLLTRNFDAALYQTLDPQALSGQFGCNSIPTDEANDVSRGNASGFCDSAVDALIAEAESGESVILPAAHAEAVRQAEAAIQQQAPAVPLYAPLRAVYARDVDGLKPAVKLPITWNAWEWK
jgi:peptide/nickel transport system substrate-binding protein